MILKSFLLGNLLSLCMKIINSVVVVGLYYGFLTTFSIGPSYLFLLRARVMEEGTEKEVSATTGFITGQFMMFISIYYAPLHLALGRPHTITVLVLPYLLFHFFWNNHKHFFDYGSTTRNSMRNLSIQCVFLNNLIFQLFNHFILPSSTLARLVNIYMFRCNNKMLFVTSSFVGWLIGHILFMKWVGLVLFWIRQNHSIRSNVLIRSNKYLVSEFINSMARIFSILLFITCVYYLGRIPSSIVTKKLKETSETEEGDVKIETTSETKGTEQEQKGSTEEGPSLCSEEKEDPDKIDETEEIRVNGKEKTKDELDFRFQETWYNHSTVYDNDISDSYGDQEDWELEILKLKDKQLFWFEKPLVTLLFDYQRWNRPLRYINNNDRFPNAVRNEMSQYFFDTSKRDGNKIISFTYPPSLSIFNEMIQKKIFLSTTEKLSPEGLYNHSNYWIYANEQKKYNLSNEFINRIEALDKGSLVLDVLEQKNRLCNDENEQECLPKMYDPFLNGPYRGRIKKYYLHSIRNDSITSTGDSVETVWINRIHDILPTYREFGHKMNIFDGESLSTDIGDSLISIGELAEESASSLKLLALLAEQRGIDSENKMRYLSFPFDRVTTDPNNQTIRNETIGLEEIGKRVPRWLYRLTEDLEEQEDEDLEESTEDHGIRSRKAKRVIIFADNDNNTNTNTHTSTENTINSDQGEELTLLRYSQKSDFRRNLIKGSMRAQRRKTVTWEMFQINVHSPLFLDRIDKTFSFSFDISRMMNLIFRNRIGKDPEFQTSDSEKARVKEEDKKEEHKKKEDERITIAELFDTIIFAQAIRGSMLVIQSILRKYIILPSLIMAKNIGRMLLFQFPEWYEDWKAWSKEMHVKCTYNGVQLSETEFPKDWLTDGIQIKILFPFCLKPWRRSKLGSHHIDRIKIKKKEKKDNFCFLTIWGMEAELPFGSPRKRPSFFKPIWKEFQQKITKVKKKRFLFLRVFKKRTKGFLKISKEKTRWVIKIVLFIKKKMKELTKETLIVLFGLRKVYEPNENRKDSIISDKITPESSLRVGSMDWTNYSLTEKKMKDLADRTTPIRDQIERITKDKKDNFITPNINISPNERSCGDKRPELQKHIWKVFKKGSARLIPKWNYFMKSFIQRIYIDIFLYAINMPRVNAQLFLELRIRKKMIDKYIYNDETNQNTIHFISTIKSLSNITNISNSNISNNNSQIYCDLSSLSQAYVFYILSQTQVLNKYYLKSLFQHDGEYPFIKDKIKDHFLTRGIFHSESRYKQLPNCRMNEWKNWLRGHYQYNLSHTRWSRLVPRKWRNGVNQHHRIKKKNSKKWDSYEKDQLIHYEKDNSYAVDSLPSPKKKMEKHYKYDLLSHKYINYGYRKDSYIYGSPLQINGDREIPYNYNTHKSEPFYVPGDIAISNYLGEEYIISTDKNPDRKYLDWRIIHFCLRNNKNINIETWGNMNTEIDANKNTKIGTNDYQIINKKGIFYLTTHQEINPRNQKKNLFDWMGMNQEILYRPRSNLKSWFFPEFMRLYEAYKTKPWIIPTQLLIFHFDGNQKKDLHISSNQKEHLELETQNQEEKKRQDKKNPGSDAQNQKDVEEDSTRSDSKKRSKKKKPKSKSNKEAELDFFLKRYFLFQLRWDDPLNQKRINNIKVYCLLLRLMDPKEIALASIQRGEMCLAAMKIQKDLAVTELIKKGILILEPVRLSIKWDGQFIMYQTIGISLVHKSKHKTNRRCREKRYVDENYFDISIEQHGKMLVNRDKKNHDLLVPENILSLRRRRELRILIRFNSENRNIVNRNPVFLNGNGSHNCEQFVDRDKHLDTDTNKFIKWKLFIWPNYRLEDLACMNRYWFDTNNGSHFSMSRIYMYPRFRIS
uniref:Hypothetical chloroplast RF1 n=1 Tax=Illicium henryi TaxID=114516 RepID=A0A1W6CCC2_9MAGN|nr:hypothetical chloroplast RF1 [Illicium henryi]YP_010534759.1 Ycf1 protein [Illicium dunnianum]ARJ62437.1 hypothetical chloroplast RF1 [Illicium henryi]UYA96031.1 Ycf1 protein [Illicium dunnianum]UYA96505.1 Ycf1 protein [Illicium henryi]